MRLERTAQDPIPCVPVPHWVDHRPYLSEIPDTEVSCIANGLCRLLYDAQVDLCHGEPVCHYRTVQRVLTREGAERAAHVVVEFDPGFQRLEVHFVRVVRGGASIEHARPGAFQVFRRETNLERLIFDGRLTASLLIPDVRVDDVVEVCVTLYGGAPVLGGKYVAWAVFDWFDPWFDARQRLLRPSERKVFVKRYNDPPEPTIAVNAEIEDSRWQIIGQRRREPEALTPPWVVLRPAMQFSEFASWNDVASLLAPFYESDGLPEPLAEEVDRFAMAYSDPDQRAVEWLRFVQRELRYFAFSLGEGGLTPRSLEAIWATRFGDCKDAARLYAAGARRLGLEACATLVSTTHGQALSDFIPSSGVFNHCIVRLQLNGTSYWLDPTVPAQGGNLQNIFQPHAGWALPLTPQTTHLERLGGEEPLHVLHWEDEITIGPKRVSPATVHRHIDFFSWAADLIRNRFANEGTGGYAQTLLKDMQSVWPNIAETAPIEVRDDQTQNKVTLALSYEIRDCWKPGQHGSQLDFIVPNLTISRELQPLSVVRREHDIYLGRPRKITSFLQLNMPRSWLGGGWSHRYEASRVRFTNRFMVDGRTITNSRELMIDAWSLPAAETKEYGDVVKRVQEGGLVVWARERFGRIRPRRKFSVDRNAIVGLSIGLGFLLLWIFLAAIVG